MPYRNRYLFVCTNRRADGHPKGSCAERGAERLLAQIKDELRKRGATLEVRACSSSCLDMCELGPIVLQEPDNVAYGHVAEEDAEEIAVAAIEGGIVERRVLQKPT